MSLENQIENQIDNIINTTTYSIEHPDSQEHIDIEEQADIEQADIEQVDIEQADMEQVNMEQNMGMQIDEGEIEVFNNALHQYLRIDEEIKTLMQAIRTRNEMKKNLGETLSNYLKANQIKNVNLDGSYKGKRLENIVNHTTIGFNKANVTEAIYNELQENQEIFAKIMEALSKTTVIKEVCKLKITDEKKVKKSNGNNNGKRKTKEHNAFGETSYLLDNI